MSLSQCDRKIAEYTLNSNNHYALPCYCTGDTKAGIHQQAYLQFHMYGRSKKSKIKKAVYPPAGPP